MCVPYHATTKSPKQLLNLLWRFSAIFCALPQAVLGIPQKNFEPGETHTLEDSTGV